MREKTRTDFLPIKLHATKRCLQRKFKETPSWGDCEMHGMDPTLKQNLQSPKPSITLALLRPWPQGKKRGVYEWDDEAW